RHTRFSRDWSSDVCSSDLCINPNHKSKVEKLAVITRLATLILHDQKATTNQSVSLLFKKETTASGAIVEISPWLANTSRMMVDEMCEKPIRLIRNTVSMSGSSI